jgi:hypothetical protein
MEAARGSLRSDGLSAVRGRRRRKREDSIF